MRKYLMGIIFILALSNLAFGVSQEDPDTISLDLKGMDIRDVLKILSQNSGLNIVADSDVKGLVTAYIKDVNVMSALDIIASINNLAYEQDGTLVRVMREAEYEKNYGSKFRDKTRTEVIKLNYANASEIVKVATEMRASKGKVIADDASNTIILVDIPENLMKMRPVILAMDVPLVTEVFSLDYAKAELIKDKLEQMVSKSVGSVKFDERTNRIIIKDTPQKIEDIRKVIQAFDEKTREVVIEANIIQVTLSDKYSFGIDWANVTKMGDIKFTADTNLSTGLSNVTPSKFTIGTTGGNTSAIISLLKTYGRADILSKPKITVIDKQEAKILVGSKEPYVTSEVTTTEGGTYHTTDNVQFVDVGVSLIVTPEINRAGFITLKVKPAVSSADDTKTVRLTNPDGSTRTIVPYVTTSEAQTSVMVKDGTTVIIGGLMKDTITKQNDRVPFLGDIPVFGKLFTAKGESKQKTELVILLTPRIIEGDATTDDARKYMADWENKSEEARVEEPKEPEIKWPEAKHSNGKREKWAPILGTKNPLEVRNVEILETKPIAEPLVSKKTPYEEYYFKVRQDINDLASQDADVRGINGEVQLQFTLDKEGFVIKGPIVLNNPDLRLVRSAVRVIKKAMPFERFPKGFNRSEADFNVSIRYE